MKVLLVEDEKRLSSAIKYLLNQQKIECDVAYDGQKGYELVQENEYSVIILDIMLPGMNGYEVLKNIRKDKNNTPIMMLTAKADISSKVEGLDLGADDYMTKPFDAEELIARVKALARRSGFVVLNSLSYEDLQLNIDSGELICGNEIVKLNFKEKEIMKIFLISPNNIITKELLIDKVWGFDSDATSNNVEAYISFLRRKIKFLNSKLTIKGYQKFGYKLEVLDDKEIKD